MDKLIDILGKLFILDTTTMIDILFWGNVVAAILVYTFQTLNESKNDKKSIKRLTVIHILYAVGYLLLLLRDVIPDVFSVNFGNTLLFTCFYLEAVLMLILIDSYSKNLDGIIKYILVASVTIFNFLEMIFHNRALRVTMASVIIFLILCIPVIKMVTTKRIGKFKFGIGIFYSILLLSLIIRTIVSINADISLHSNNLAQSVFFLSLIVMMVSCTMTHLLLMKEKNDSIMEKIAKIDGLTTVINRFGFMDEAEKIFNQCMIKEKKMTVIFFDIDDFKNINVKYGHRFGDRVLKCFSDILKIEYIEADLLCRYNGEEFIVILCDSSETEDRKSVLRVLNMVKKYRFDDTPDFSYTVSAGIITEVPKPGMSVLELIEKSNITMYAAKKQGKNTYCCI